MLSRLLRAFAAVLLVLSLALPFAAAQNDMPSVERGVGRIPEMEEQKKDAGPALPYFVMAVYAIAVLTIVCMPSRKA